MKKALSILAALSLAATMTAAYVPASSSAIFFNPRVRHGDLEGVEWRCENDIIYIDSVEGNILKVDDMCRLEDNRQVNKARYFVFGKDVSLERDSFHQYVPEQINGPLFDILIWSGYNGLYGTYVYEGSPMHELYEELISDLTIEGVRSEEWLRSRLPIHIIPEGEELPEELCDYPFKPSKMWLVTSDMIELKNKDVRFEQVKMALTGNTIRWQGLILRRGADIYGDTKEEKLAELSLLLDYYKIHYQAWTWYDLAKWGIYAEKDSEVANLIEQLPEGLYSNYIIGTLSGTYDNGLKWEYDYDPENAGDHLEVIINGDGVFKYEYFQQLKMPYRSIKFGENISFDEKACLNYLLDQNKNSTIKLVYGSDAHKNVIDFESNFDYISQKLFYDTVPATINAEGPFGLYGDADGNGSVDINDVIKLMCYAANPGVSPLTETEKVRCDVYSTGDGINVSDANRIQMYLANMIEG